MLKFKTISKMTANFWLLNEICAYAVILCCSPIQIITIRQTIPDTQNTTKVGFSDKSAQYENITFGTVKAKRFLK